MHLSLKSPKRHLQVRRALQPSLFEVPKVNGIISKFHTSRPRDVWVLPTAQPISTPLRMQCGLLALESVWEKPFKSYSCPVPLANKGHRICSKLVSITSVPHKSRSSQKRKRICCKKMYLHVARHPGPVWILMSPEQNHDWARYLQVIPSLKS